MQARAVITLEGNINQTYLESMRSEDGTAWLSERSNQSRSWVQNEIYWYSLSCI
jgi:hypothetical protein